MFQDLRETGIFFRGTKYDLNTRYFYLRLVPSVVARDCYFIRRDRDDDDNHITKARLSFSDNIKKRTDIFSIINGLLSTLPYTPGWKRKSHAKKLDTQQLNKYTLNIQER